MKNGKHNVKQKFPRLSNLHIIWRWTKRIAVVGLLVALVANYGTGSCLAVVAGFLIVRALIRLAFRIIVMLVSIALLLLILGLIIL
ncbi:MULTISPECIES: hypothetical protein [Bacteroidales]|uniref:hypothetical protein n=1 Tax=Bacteroidales TaxID=171549 RepID=UPI000A1C8083|nr:MULTISPECIES: hypothetical protein [Bacteroidales]